MINFLEQSYKVYGSIPISQMKKLNPELINLRLKMHDLNHSLGSLSAGSRDMTGLGQGVVSVGLSLALLRDH